MVMKTFTTLVILTVFTLAAAFFMRGESLAMDLGEDIMKEEPTGYPVATLAGGCFWCLESEFRALDGVLFTKSGYTGGHLDDPEYRDVTTGETGHAEAVEITFDPAKISYGDLVKFFLTKAHDPTQVNRQGVDVGPQYRSEIFYHDEEQKRIAQEAIKSVEESGVYKKPIATKISPAGKFWEAEEYHQQYYEKYEEQNGSPHIRVLLKKAKKVLP